MRGSMMKNLKLKPLLKGLCLAGLLWLGSGCGGGSRFVAPDAPPNDRRPVPSPQSREINLAADNVDKLGTMQVQRLFDLSRHARNIAGDPKPAMNIDAFDEVHNSSWFNNRNGQKPLTLKALAQGPNREDGPDTSGIWTIFRAKAQGVTPGFSIVDKTGESYVIKFDPAGYSELSTGAEVVSTKLFYAAGYNVPENYLVRFDPANLRLGDEVKLTDEHGKKRFMNEEDLEHILARIEKQPDGKIRAVASRYLPGKPMGSFYYSGLRKDDANDVIPHQHRRELRGLKLIAAWLNHYDTKANNTLDMYVPEGYVRHYLIDFGSTLGSQGDEPMPPEIGREGVADPPQVLKTIGSLGAYIRPWERKPEVRFPSIGNFTAEDFRPEKYKYILPNPAFLSATDGDDFWGAKIVMSFTDEQIRTAVAQGRYHDPAAAQYLVQILIERRNRVGRSVFSRLSPLDQLEVRDSDGVPALCFTDLAVSSALESGEGVNYRYELFADGREAAEEDIGSQSCVNLEGLNAHPATQWMLKIQKQQPGGDDWLKAVQVYIEKDDASGAWVLAGIRH